MSFVSSKPHMLIMNWTHHFNCFHFSQFCYFSVSCCFFFRANILLFWATVRIYVFRSLCTHEQCQRSKQLTMVHRWFILGMALVLEWYTAVSITRLYNHNFVILSVGWACRSVAAVRWSLEHIECTASQSNVDKRHGRCPWKARGIVFSFWVCRNFHHRRSSAAEERLFVVWKILLFCIVDCR